MTRRALIVLFAVIGGLLAVAAPADAADQSAFAYGDAGFHGSTGLAGLDQPVVGMARAPRGDGYWLAGRDGRVFAFGSAQPLGSATPTSPVVAIAATPTGNGYWLATARGGVHSFGDAAFFGSMGPIALSAPITDLVVAPRGDGYWLVAEDGGVFTFGHAPYFGSASGAALRQPIAAMAPTPTGKGYWLVGRDGGVFAFGDAPFLGSTGTLQLTRSIVAIEPTPTGRGYWLLAADGGLFTYGDAPYLGSLGHGGLTEPAVDVASSPSGKGYWLVTTGHLAPRPGANPPQVVLTPGSYDVGPLGPAVPGTYRTRSTDPDCAWQRIGADGEVLATGTTGLVTIRPSDEVFATNECAPFVNEVFPVRAVRSASFGNGAWAVGADIGPWHWTAPGGSTCTWSRVADFSGAPDAVIEAGTTGEVALTSMDAGFITSGCGTWTRR